MNRLQRLLTDWLLPLCCLCMMVGILLGYGLTNVIPALVGIVFALLAAMLHHGRWRAVCLLALMLTLGSALGWQAQHPALPDEGEYHISALVSDAVQQRDTDTQVHTMLHHITLNGQPYPYSAYWSFYADELPQGLAPGSHVTFTGRLYHPSGAENPGGYDFRLTLLQKGAAIGLYGGQDDLICSTDGFCLFALMAAWRSQISQALGSMLGTDAGAYASAMLLGERSLLPDEDMSAFRRMGIAHIMSVSGYHVGVLAALITGLLTLLHVRRRQHLPVIAIVLLGYCLLTGLHPPVIRASILVVLGLYGYRLGATPVRLHWLAAAAMLQLLFSPIQLLSASFQLTYGALLGIILMTPVLQRCVKHNRLLARILDPFFAALGAQIGILLPELYWFHELPALGLVANFLLLGLISLLMGMYWLCLPLMLIPGVSSLFGTLTAGATAAFAALIRTVSHAAGVMIWTRQANVLTAIGWLIILICINGLWPRWNRRHGIAASVGVLLLIISVLPWPTHGVTYTQLSVGESDAAVLQDEHTVVVIDAGESSALATYLHARRMSVDTLILTHLHADHTGGIAALLNDGIPIRQVLLPFGAEDCLIHESMSALLSQLREHGASIEHAARGDILPLPHGNITVLWPEADRVRRHQSANEYSMAMLVRLYHTTLLLTGDLSGTYESFAGVPADVLKAAHHGSATSTSQDFLSIVQPSLVLQSCGTDARVDGLRSRLNGIPLFATQEHGAITLSIDADGFTVQPYLP